MVGTILAKLRHFLASEDGPTAVEYSVMLMVIVLGCIFAIKIIGVAMSEEFTDLANGIFNATSN